VIANTALCLIHQANYLLDQQIAGLEREFVQEGGYTEKLAAARLVERRRQKEDRTDPSDRTDRSDIFATAPTCPTCGKPMVLRTARKGRSAGSQFWGCSGYPDCKGTRPL
jgi:four helix bundle suffix protein